MLPFGAVGTVLDLTALILALVVAISLAVLAWTLGVSAVRRVRGGRQAIARLRAELADAERRLHVAAATTRDQLRVLAERARLGRRTEA